MFSTRYLANEPLFVTTGLSIRGIGIRETMPAAFIARPAGSGDALVMLFHAAVSVGTERTSQRCAPNTIVLWGPGEAQYYGNRNDRWSHSWVHCDGPQVVESMLAGGLQSGEPILLRNPARVERYMLDLHEELRGKEADGPLVENTFANLVREAVRSREQPALARPPENLSRARASIDAHYDEKLTLEVLAGQAHLSVPHFCSEFGKWFGVPPISYLIRRRMEAAAVLLSGTSLDISEVGRRVGYDDLYHFSKSFSQSFGVSPRRFRQGAAATGLPRTRAPKKAAIEHDIIGRNSI